MKILIVQLARLGDIYLSWPMVRALRRQHPQAEIHVMSRSRFRSAWVGVSAVDAVHSIPGEAWLEPLLKPEMDLAASFEQVVQFVQNHRAQNYTHIYNLSYSPISSYITHAITTEQTEVVRGYTRFADGYLDIPDDISAYFYAQVGTQRANRFHLAEIFSSVAGLDLVESDWDEPQELPEFEHQVDVLIHIGASEQQKTLSPEKWINFINSTLRKNETITIGLLGQSGEQHIAQNILASVSGVRVKNFVGQTTLGEAFTLIKNSKVLVGCDSAPIHMASLVKTPSLQFSVGIVNFFETGPRAPGSCVVRAKEENDLASDYMTHALDCILNKHDFDPGVFPLIEEQPCYKVLASSEAEFQWNLLKGIYQGEALPVSENKVFNLGLTKLADVNQLILDNLKFISDGGAVEKVSELINRCEEVIQAIGGMLPTLGIVTRWYQTEKTRIPPGTQAEVLARTVEIHNQLAELTKVYAEMNSDEVKREEGLRVEEGAT